MSQINRRQLLTTAVHTSAALAARAMARPVRIAATPPRKPIKIGQIGTGHEHASGKMDTFRKLSDYYEVVGIVEPDPELRKRRADHRSYRDLAWMTEEELLNTEGWRCGVEVDSDDDRIMDIAGRCINAGKHIHLDKPGGRILQQVQESAGRSKKSRTNRAIGLHVPEQSGHTVLSQCGSAGLARPGLRSPLRHEQILRRRLPEISLPISRRNHVYLCLPHD